LFGVDQKYDRLYKDFLFGDFIRANEARTPEKMAAERCVNMRSLDGGGIRGLVTLQMMKEVERYLKHTFASYCTWFSGTSTGSFISAFLSMGISLNQIRATYFRFKVSGGGGGPGQRGVASKQPTNRRTKCSPARRPTPRRWWRRYF